ncbi:MAG TPA: HD domain-containing phosphohydrolase [Gemmatimonadales bacterium]|nr:HD domain-containing phosphohydrolase [Gemmatimonadales bacterium]
MPQLTNNRSGRVPDPARALVVDDDAQVRRTLVRVLQSHGIATLEAGNGRQAVRVLEAEAGSIPLVVSDIYMPEMDGIELLRVVHNRWPDVAVIMLTGVAEVATAVECLQVGALDYLSKPILVDEVRARVDSALEKRHLVLENRFLQQSYQDRLESSIRELNERNKDIFLGQIQMAVRMLEKKDVYTRGHSQRVSRYAVKTAVLLGFNGDELNQIRLGGELHDIGKIGTRDTILQKPGRLTLEEFEEMKRHVLEGEEILEPLRHQHPLVLQIVRHHHERMNGSGFPDGLSGERIPDVARLVCVVDAFDAMTSNRAYCPSFAPAEAMDELHRFAGAQFDPKVVSAFSQAFPDPARLPLLV